MSVHTEKNPNSVAQILPTLSERAHSAWMLYLFHYKILTDTVTIIQYKHSHNLSVSLLPPPLTVPSS